MMSSDPAAAEAATPDTRGISQAILADLFGPRSQRSFAVRFWDGTVDLPGGGASPPFTVVLQDPGALRRMLLPPSESSIAEAYVFGDVDIEGDLEAAASLSDSITRNLRSPKVIARLLPRLLALPSGDERDGGREDGKAHRLRGLLRLGRRHSRRRDAAAVRFHYDVGNDFYALWLDSRLIYSCAYFPTGEEDLEAAQTAKLDHICRKLRLREGERLLDIGCGWGALILHAAKRYGVEAVGITLSEPQARLARERIAAAGLADRCRVEVRDYRELPAGSAYDKLVSVGMVEHVGEGKLPEYFAAAYRVLRPGGLFLNHGIIHIAYARPTPLTRRLAGALFRRDGFIARYVFPDGKLVSTAEVIASAEAVGFETRDVESLREHYARTLRHWVHRLEDRHDDAVRLVGEPTYRVWRLYMAASARGFATGRTGIIQTLLAKPEPGGRSNLPLSRADLYAG